MFETIDPLFLKQNNLSLRVLNWEIVVAGNLFSCFLQNYRKVWWSSL